MDEFPSNSKNLIGTGREEKKPKKEKDIQKVVTGEVMQRKTPLGRKFKNVLFGGEFKGATRYIAMDVLLPAFRNMVVDATTKGIERVVFGESSMRRTYRQEPRSRYSYNSPVERYGSRPRAMLPDQPPHISQSRRRQDVGEIILASKADAEAVLEEMMDVINDYDVVSVADLNACLGRPSSYVDNNWGWTILKPVDIRQIREGFLLDLPPAEAI
jgi:hypothetical protein